MPRLNQEGIAHLFLLFILVIGIGIGIFLVQNPTIFKPKATENPPCKVSDIPSLQDCFARARVANSGVDKIEITKQIDCYSSDCRTDLTKRDAPLLIYGTPNTAAGFRRIGNYNYHILLLGDNLTAATKEPQKVSLVTLKDLIFDDTTQSCDESVPNNCLSPIVVGPNNSDTTIDHITILHAKSHGIQVENAFKLTVKNSIIYDSDTNGIWFDDARANPCLNFVTCPSVFEKRSKIITIENNLIANSRVAAIEFYAYGNDQYHNSIKGNLIVHNHRDSKFIFCPPHEVNDSGQVTQVGGHCPGGQLAVARTEFLDIENNIIRNGRIDGTKPNDPYLPLPGTAGAGKRYEEDLNLHTTGIELSSQLQNVVVSKNKIYNNTGAGIFADYTFYNLADMGFANSVGSSGVVQLTSNYLNSNSFNFGRKGVTNLDNVPGIYNVGNGASVSLNFPKAFIFADPPICYPEAGKQCNTKIRWYSEDQKDINVGIKDDAVTILGTTADGETAVPWLSKAGGIFEIRSGKNLLASTFATEYNPNPTTSLTTDQNQAPIPSPSSNPIPSTSPSPSPSPSPSNTPVTTSQPISGTGAISATACSIPYGATTCTSKIVWTTSNTSEPVQVFIKEANVAISNATSGQLDAPWIGKSPLTFELKIGSKIISSVAVKATPLISASPNPCKLTSSGNCTSTITLNAPGYPNLQIKIREANNASMGAGASPTGKYDAPWISASPLTFDLYSDTNIVDSVVVKGTP